MKTLQKDLTTGNPGKIIFNFTLPIFIGNVFQQFYSMADTIIVGKFVGTKALAAVGSTGTIMFLINGFILGMTAGFTVLTAQKFGAGDMKAMRKTVGNAAILAIIMSLIMTVLGKMDEMRQTVGNALILTALVSAVMTAVSMTGMHALLKFMHTPDDIFKDAYAYIMVICGGIAAQMLYNFLSSVLRALGNSKVPLYFLILAALLNIVLDMVFIIAFHMGAAGAAWATVISQGISGILCLVYIVKAVPILHLHKEDWRPSGHLLKIQLAVGIPMALQYSITAIGTMMVQTALNLLGSTQVAAFTAANKIEQIVTQAYVAMGTTMATYCAQNIGAGKIKRIRQGFKSITIMGSIYSVVVAAIIMTVGKYMTYLFLSGDLTEIMHSVDIYLKCVGTFFIPLTVVNVYRNGIQGMGYGLLPMMAGVAELVGRGVVAMIAAGQKSYFGVCMASPAAWILASALLIVMYYYVIHQNEKRFAKYADEE